ncbi:MAG: cyclic nucleotide-binding domain-containing protein [Gammaproteobacteria bacterium]|nr:cyclic nucleotide-binding domain-containing protein [Gammaproteobacteria bacterium]
MLKSPSFRNLPVANIEQLFEHLDLKIVTAGEVIIRQGDVGDYFYMINEGTAQVSREIDDEYGSIEMAELSVGSSFGEAALISDSSRNATVSMMSDGVLLRLSKEDFLQLLKEPALTHLTEQEAAAKIAAGGQWLDIRQRADFDAGHRKGALHASLNEMHMFAQQLSQNRPYICYCQTGQRSAAAAFIISQYGIDVYVLG